MTCWHLLLIALLQGPADVSGGTDPAREVDLPGVVIERVPLKELRQRIAENDYLPVPRNFLPDLFRVDRKARPGMYQQPQIREARYVATLNGTRLDQGRLEFDINPVAGSFGTYPLFIGQTNLQQLKISDQQGEIELGSDSSRRLFLLKHDLPLHLAGTWTSDGLVAGDVATFRLELPAATTTQFELLTKPGVLVTSAGSLVLGPEPAPAASDASASTTGSVTDSDHLMKWRILPGDSVHLTFSCRELRLLQSMDPLALISFNASHALDVLAGDILNSRWTIGLPSVLNGRSRLTARIPGRARVSAVVMEDKRPVEWRVTEQNGQQLLSLLLPDASESGTLTVFAASLLPQSESWDLPMLSFDQWYTRDDQQHGPILVPIGQISVLLPPSVHLDEWTLVGLQERDIVTGQGEIREYQLMQFLPEASAIARVSTSEPRLDDSVVTIVEPAGRLATVRCLVNIKCEGAAMVELQWPVSQGWQLIAARYAMNSRALFFEFPQPDPDAATSTLTLHLPEPLEPGFSRLVELQFRQADEADARTINLPLMENRDIKRINSIAVFPPTLTLSTELQRRWSTGRRALTLDDVRNSMAWLPESKLPTGGQFFSVGGSDSSRSAAAIVPELSKQDAIELEHAVRIVDGQIVETSRILLPANQQFAETLPLLLPARSSQDAQWSMDGQPISARHEDTGIESPDWERWSLNLAGRRSEVATILRCESRQPAGQKLIASIPIPVADLPIRGILQLFSSDEGQLTVTGLRQIDPEQPREALTDDQSTIWELPADPTVVPLMFGQNPGSPLGQTIDIHMLHMFDTDSGGLLQQVMAVANISRSTGRASLPLALPTGIRPLVLVNGHRVQLQDSATGPAIPLPAAAADCQLVLTWSEPAPQPDKVTGSHLLPRLFAGELSAPQYTHHVLLSPELEFRAADTNFSAANSTDVIRILDRLMLASQSAEENARPVTATKVPPEIRSFISRWQLANLLGWQKLTLIDTVTSNAPVVISVTQLRRRVAIAIGTALLLVALCITLRQIVLEYRLGVSLTAVSVLGVHSLLMTSITEAILAGTFWGLLIGLAVVTLTQWKWLCTLSRRTFARTTAGLVSLLIIVHPCSGQENGEQQNVVKPGSELQGPSASVSVRENSESVPDVLLPEVPVLENDVAWVRKSILEKWQKNSAVERTVFPTAVVTALRTEILAESVESVELLLKMDVATVSGNNVAHVRIPLSGSRLVECTIDGDSVLPEPDGPNAIRISIPGSSLLPTLSLSEFADENRAAADVHIDDADAAGTVVDAGPHAAFTIHQIECRLRPVTVRQSSGLQFRLPALPCPVAEIKVIAPEGLFTGVRAQSPAGVIRWAPSDNAVQLSSLAMSEGIDIRLFQSNVEKGSPQLATVEMLTIAEVIAEQSVLSCFCRFARWNPLTPEVRYHIPQGYQLVSVNSINGGELLWSAQERVATILLPNTIGKEFVLSLQLKASNSSPLLQRRIPIAELIQFPDCVVSPNLQLAVRVNPVFSVLRPEDRQVTTLGFNEAQSAWGQWLRRSDSVFNVPSGLSECIVRLTARKSLNEVRIDQKFTLLNQHIDWTCQMDIDTSVLPVFRHRLTISPDIEVENVQENAGEVNRPAAWHRRGDRLVVQLKEGTTGRHLLKISGRQILRPDDTRILLHSPHMQDAQILESVLTLTDQEGLGLRFEKLGSAVPNDRIANDDLLQPGVPVRMQILEESDTLEESDPIVLQRLRPVEPVGSIAVLRSVDQAAVVVHLTQWSGSLGPLEMTFTSDTEFRKEPSVLVEGRLLSLNREGNKFVAGRDVVRELFDQPEFSILWSVPIDESQRTQESMTLLWPEISDRIQWTERLLIPLDTAAGNRTTESVTVPAWLSDSSAIGFGKDLTAIQVKLSDPVPQLADSGELLSVPLNRTAAVPDTAAERALFAVSDSVLWSNPGQSAVGQTTIVIFSSHPPGSCTLIIPGGTIVTELESEEATRWEDARRQRATLKLTKPATVVQIRWMSEQAKSGFASSTLKFAAPYPAGCETRHNLTVASSESELPKFPGEVRVVSESDLNSELRSEIAAGLTHAQLDNPAVTVVTELLPPTEELAAQLISQRAGFIHEFTAPSGPTIIMASCRPASHGQMEVFSRKRLRWPTVVSIAAGFLAVAGAAFGQTMRPEVSEAATRIATQISDSRQSGSKSQSSAGGQPPKGGSTSGGAPRQPQS